MIHVFPAWEVNAHEPVPPLKIIAMPPITFTRAGDPPPRTP